MAARVATTWKYWLQLARLPNVFTALGNVLMGWLVVHGTLAHDWRWLALATISGLHYVGGMFLNDAYDAEQDAIDRPQRPIPAGHIARQAALRAGFALLAAGILLAGLLSATAGDPFPVAIAALLAVCIWLYDARLKSTGLGPLVMGACRSLNVLLGTSLLPPNSPVTWSDRLFGLPAWIAAGIGIYIVGVTWLARREATTSSRTQLLAATGVLMVGLIMLAALSSRYDLQIDREAWLLLWGVTGIIIARRCVLAILSPTPTMVQRAIKHCILSLIVIDATITFGFAGPGWAVVVLALLAPTMLFGRWFSST